ncbi:lysophospholipid acyltransferase family protein [Massilia sp. YIM B02763]|uniref:lysophospholipid acyltransferase family protein n=1 Tax=Massilia sp. YIM B02763 TaxID=3050130 RepID=UPI0025B69A16|nr:lysophospholipid acyltransferase family protein [Massilia sp. YIM B02763]MDN4051882.1 lysophospholipid acyltransferase family protein [Massilia sp. YIM B02763]
MLDALGRGWRVLATGLSFALFGLGGLLLRVLVFPLLTLCVSDPEARVRAARATVRLSFRAFVGTMRLLGVLRYEVRGLDKLAREGQLILANHPTLIDTVFLMAFVRNADCIVKGGLWNNPFTRGPVRAAGYICNDRGPKLVDDCIASLRAGGNLIIFPEGTRTPRDGSMELKRGAANVAVRGERAVTPVRISCEPLTLGKGDKWWHVPPRQAAFCIEVMDDIGPERFLGPDVTDVLAARRLTQYLQHYFMEEGQQHA